MSLPAYIAAAPFVSWLNSQCEHYGEMAMRTDLGVSQKWLYRHKNQINDEGKRVDHFKRQPIEDALDRTTTAIWEIYPDLIEDPDLREGFCSRCKDRVLIGADDRCLWCETPTTSPMSRAERASYISNVCPRCGDYKQKYSVRCRDCATELARGVPRKQHQDPEQFVCPHCGGWKECRSMRCRRCFHKLGLDHRPKTLPEGTKAISEEQLVWARELYDVHGLGMREVVEHVEHSYSSPKVAICSLYRAFQARNWPLRGKGEAKALLNERRRRLGQLPQGKARAKIRRTK